MVIKQLRNMEYVISSVVFIVLISFSMYIWTAVGLATFVYIALRFFNNVSTTIDIRDLVLLIPIIQWIIGPWLSYKFSTDEVFYYMSVPEEQYMTFVVPAVLAFIIGIYLKINRSNPNMKEALFQIESVVKVNKNIDLLFIIVGIVANILNPHMPSSLIFFTFLFGNLQYVGLFLLLINKDRKIKKILFAGVITIMSLIALARGMFQLLLLWFTFLFIIISFINNTSNVKKIFIALSIFIVAFFVQSVKSEFRSITWGAGYENISNTEVFSELISERLDRTELLTSEENVNNIIGRINQGWIISRIMRYVPTYEPFANGETIINAITGTLLPRFLNPNKVKAGNADAFVRFTGRKLLSGTAMGMSVVGESYANFGKNGGVIFMFLFGLFLNLSHSFLISKLKDRPILLFFFPLIFLQVVKAESNFMIILNHLIKSTIFVFLVLWGLKTFLNMKKL